MAVSIHASVTVGTGDLRRALTAVRVHASADHEIPHIHRVRLMLDTENVVVVATDTFTAGMAIVSVWDTAGGIDELPLTVDLAPGDVANILRIFTAGKEKDDIPDYQVRLDVTADRLTVTDSSGMIDGHAFTVPRLPTDGSTLCKIPALLAAQHESAPARLDEMSVGGETMARFKTAAAAYGEGLDIAFREASRMLLVRCGESFLGGMMPRHLSDASVSERRDWADGWTRRLPGIVAAADADRAEYGRPVQRAELVDLDAPVEDREMLLAAVDLVVRTQFGSPSMLQRKLRIAFVKAARLIEEMAQRGIVGPATAGTTTRDVLVPVDRADELLAALRESGGPEE